METIDRFYGMYPSINNHSFLDYPENDDCFTVFFTGCLHNCENCQNKELQKTGLVYEEIEYKKFVDLIKKISKRLNTKNIVLQGGDPLHPQNRNFVKKLIFDLKEDYDFCIYTGYCFDEIKEYVRDCKYVITEKFDMSKFITPEKTDDYFQLASSNQKIYKNNKLISEKGKIYFEKE